MNKKLITLAVAAAITAPGIASAEAIIYGRLNFSVDYVDVTNAILPVANYNPYGGPSYWARNGEYLGNVVPGQAGPWGAVPVAPQQVGGGQDFSGWSVTGGGGGNYIPVNAPITGAGGGRASNVGFKGSEDLGNGLKAVYQIEFGINTDTNGNVTNNGDALTYRNTFVGLAGDWGTALVGRHDTPLKISTAKLDLFANSLADNNTTVGFNDQRADNAIAYISPNFSGFSLAAMTIAPGGATALGTNTPNNLNTESEGINEGWSLAGIYSNGPFYASVAYESLGYELYNTNANNFGCSPTANACTTSDNDYNKWRFGLGLLDWNGFSLTGIYEQQEGIPGSDAYTTGSINNVTWVLPGNPDKADLWQIQAAYAFGNNTIKGMYGVAEFSSDNFVAVPNATTLRANSWNDLYEGDRQTWAVGFDHNFSKRTQVYALYTDVSDDRSNWIAGSEWSGFSLGVVHKF